ncbi:MULTISPECIES: helix-turn-helix transcriptional regulator [Streptomyces]|uniref:Helix-turn-helix transcriptional regulator n=1 Tax=Streptomyces canarius TaxID=285453 RepID=A0ABQ3D914_9ACTN|nr:helix-turn-helix transcriptional regulator [Streptomyces canarius]GHA61770.1 helix-turn-helix transcriptional regulator [Streptomyces canarius]
MIQATDIPPTTDVAAVPVPAAVPRGHGRQREQILQRVLRLLHRAEGGVLWIEGPAGAGKSRLLAFAAEEAAPAGALVLTGGGVAAHGMPPLAPLLDALGPLPALRSREPGTAHREPGSPYPEAGSPYQLMRQVEDRLRDLAHDRPLVVVLDDVQHCDELTLLAVRGLTARLAGLPVLWVLAARSHLDVPAVESLRRDLLAERAVPLDVTALEPDAVRLLVRDLLGPRAAQADPYLPLCGGLPGAVRQLCALLASRTGTAGAVRTGADPVAGAVAARRLDQLTQHAKELVLIASALGDSLTVRHLSRVLGCGESALLRPLGEVLAAGLMRAGQQHLAFAHPSVRDAVVATLPSPVRLSVRRRSVDLRLADGTPPAVLAAEIAELAEPGDEHAIRVLATAARELAPHSPATAAAHLRRAVELSRDAAPRRMRLAARLIPLLWETGESDEARALAREVVQVPPDAATHARVCLELTRMGGRFPVAEAEAHLRRALGQRGVPQPVKDQLLSTTLLNRLLAGEAEEAGGTLAGSLARARGTHPLNDLTQRTLRSMSACHRQRWTEALGHSESVPAKVAELDPAYGPALPEVVVSTVWRAALLGLAGDGTAAAELVEGGLADAEQRGRRAYLPLWRTARARLLLDGGRLPEAAREVAAAGAGPLARGTSAASEAAMVCARARIAFHTGDDAELEACSALAETYLEAEDRQSRRAGAWIAVLTALYRDEALTRHQLGVAAAHLRRGFLHATCLDAGDVVLLVAAALASGQRDMAAAAVEFAEERARLNPGLPLFAGAAAHARGLFARDADLLAEAAERYGTARPLLRARALEDAGECAAEADAATARSHFEEASRLYTGCGAERDGRRVHGRLRKLGIRPLGAAGAAAPAVPEPEWRGLTRSELGVVRLIAHGATNREAAERLFLSPHTVNTHLRHAFEKLGVRSRVQLARLYAREVDSAAVSA